MNSLYSKSEQEQLIQQMESNLYHLYGEIARQAGGEEDAKEAVKYVNLPDVSWPRTIFDQPRADVDFTQVVAKIQAGTLPPFWIMCHREKEALHQQLLAEGFRHMAQWPGMVLLLENRDFPKLPDAVEITLLTEEEDLKAWLALVNENLMKTSPLDFTILKKCVEHTSRFQLYGLKVAGQMVATGLTYLCEGMLGLYMLSTDQKHRRRGYTTLLLQHILATASQQGQRIAGLQASEDGKWVYPKLGFQTICHFDIYWLLGYR